MKYAIIRVSNGSYKVEEEGIPTIEKGKSRFHHFCEVYWSAPDVISGTIMLADENLDPVDGYREYVYHAPTEPEA